MWLLVIGLTASMIAVAAGLGWGRWRERLDDAETPARPRPRVFVDAGYLDWPREDWRTP